MNNTLRSMWASGEIKSPRVQELAAGALKQGAEGLNRLASIGTSGKHRGNMFRDMCAALGEPVGSSSLMYVRIPTTKGDVNHPVLMPHLLFGILKSEKPELFKSAILGGKADCSWFWESENGCKLARSHPVLSSRHKAALRKQFLSGFMGMGECSRTRIRLWSFPGIASWAKVQRRTREWYSP